MTAYQGGKAKLAKYIFPILKQYDKGQPYLEPFIGLGSVMRLFALENGKRKLYGSDINPDLILMLKELRRGWKPPSHISKEEYYRIRDNKKPSALRGFAGISTAYRGMFMHSYFSEKTEPASRNLPLLARDLSKVILKNIDYTSLNPKGMLIYCDPPYVGNTMSSMYFDSFDHDKFWDTMRKWSKNNTVIISEYKAPSDFKCIWSKDQNMSYGTRTEKLFIIKK